jgi:hypothetical protein
LIAQTLLEVVVTSVGDVLLVVEKAIRGSLRVALRAPAEFVDIVSAWAIAFLGLAEQRQQQGRQKNQNT